MSFIDILLEERDKNRREVREEVQEEIEVLQKSRKAIIMNMIKKDFSDKTILEVTEIQPKELEKLKELINSEENKNAIQKEVIKK